MSDPRFVRLKRDPRFRRPKKHRANVVPDDRFKLKSDLGRSSDPLIKEVVDYSRGQVLMESSDEDDAAEDGDDYKKVHQDTEVDLRDTQENFYARKIHVEEETPEVKRTHRLAAVNLDWDHVRATHLYKICSSLVSTAAPLLATSTSMERGKPSSKAVSIVRRKVLSIRIYPSEFGKNRLAQEEREGPLFDTLKAKEAQAHEGGLEIGRDEEYDEDALRKYQLERLRYYYAIITCDSVDTASHIYSELQGTELERSANVFDLSFVPDDMTFDEEFRDEATGDEGTNYETLDFVTEALRHSRVKVTWDEDDHLRRITHRPLTHKDIEEGNFDAYLASSSSEDDSGSHDPDDGMKGSREKRSKLRTLLLGDGKSSRPREKDIDGDGEVDMKITFRSGLTEERGKNKNKPREEEEEDEFTIDIEDDRFKALHQEHRFAIDPSNPRFKRTKNMVVLQEGLARRRNERSDNTPAKQPKRKVYGEDDGLQRLVDRVKQKAAQEAAVMKASVGKRQKVSPHRSGAG